MVPLKSENIVIAGCNFSYNADRVKLTSVSSSLKNSMRNVKMFCFFICKLNQTFIFKLVFIYVISILFNAQQHGWLVNQKITFIPECPEFFGWMVRFSEIRQFPVFSGTFHRKFPYHLFPFGKFRNFGSNSKHPRISQSQFLFVILVYLFSGWRRTERKREIKRGVSCRD